MWPVDADGVVRLDPRRPLDETTPSHGVDMQELSERLATSEDIDIAITRLEEAVEGFSYGAHLDPAVADWTMLGDFHEKRVLHVGASFGALPLQLAATANELITVDPCHGRVRVTAQLARLMNVANLISVHGEVTELPVTDRSIDRIAATNTLEHAASLYADDKPARNLQVRWLRHLKTRLAPEGELWLAENNRFAAQHFIGRAQTGGLSFMALAPHSVSTRLHALTNGARPNGARQPGRPASEPDLKKMLHEAGFRQVEFHYAVTNYERPRFIASSARSGMITSYLETVRPGGSWRARLAIGLMSAADRLGNVGAFAPSFVIRAIT